MGEARLSNLEQQTLSAWQDCEVETGFGFRRICSLSGTPSHLVRRVTRALARKGMVKYERVLVSEDENHLGAGYVVTQQGWEFIRGRA